jgi:hypothetical protein
MSRRNLSTHDDSTTGGFHLDALTLWHLPVLQEDNDAVFQVTVFGSLILQRGIHSVSPCQVERRFLSQIVIVVWKREVSSKFCVISFRRNHVGGSFSTADGRTIRQRKPQ